MKTLILSSALALATLPALAGEIAVTEPYAISASPKSGAAFMVITNSGPADTLIGARTSAARVVQLHTHVMENGVAKMREVEGGIPLAAGTEVRLQRGGLHVMLMDLPAPLKAGDTLRLTLDFETAPDLDLDLVIRPLHAGEIPKEDGHKHGTTSP